MPDLTFAVDGIEVVPDTAGPVLALLLQVTNDVPGELIRTVLLRCQLHIEAPRRQYTEAEGEQLRDLFGGPERWGQTLRPILWTNASVTIPSFTDKTECRIPFACTFDLNIAATKYFYALSGGEAPMTLHFTGTVFYHVPDGPLQVAPISWNKESRFRFPVQVWKDVIDRHYPNVAWVCLRRDTFDLLYRFKVREGIPTLDDAISRILALAGQSAEAK